MHPRSRTAVILAVAAAITFLMAGTALSDNVERISSTVTLARTEPFHGHVTARKHACEVNRLVRVVKVKSPRNFVVIGSSHTNSHGKWAIPAPAGGAHGDYFAKVKRRKKELAGGTTTYFCTRDRSATRHFG